MKVPSAVGSKAIQLFTGTAAGQAITLLVAPILTRLYSPDEFGTLGSFTAILMILGSAISMRYELAFTDVHGETEPRALLALCFGVTVATSALAAIALLTYSLVRGGAGGLPGDLVWAVPLGMFSIGAYNTLVAAATRAQHYGAIAKTKIWQSIGSAATQIGLGTLGVGATGLLIGFVVGQSGGIVSLAKSISAEAAARPKITVGLVKALAHRFKALALQSSWTGVLDAAGFGYLLTLLLGSLYGIEVIGYVFLAERIVGRPLLMTANSLLPVYIGELTQHLKSSRPQIPALFRSIVVKQLIISTCWVGLVIVSAGYVVVPVFGERWISAVPYVQAMALAFWPQSIIQSVSHTLPILGRTSIAATWSLFRLAALALSIFVPHAFGASAVTVIYLYSGVQLLAHAVLLYFMRRAILEAADGH